MANSYFQFKQFRVAQDQCAMKVCTDSCLFGAYVPVEPATAILDIGTGTGLLALMAAQRSAATVTGVELETAAAQQAAGNFAASPWADRLQVVPTSLQDFEQVNTRAYDLIICNPPFFRASQRSPDAAHNLARHAAELPFTDLLRFAHRFLTPGGALYVLLPPAEGQLFTPLAASFGLHLQHQLLVYTRAGGKHLRTILGFHRQATGSDVATATINIRQTDDQYSPAFQQLLQPYYLIF